MKEFSSSIFIITFDFSKDYLVSSVGVAKRLKQSRETPFEGATFYPCGKGPLHSGSVGAGGNEEADLRGIHEAGDAERSARWKLRAGVKGSLGEVCVQCGGNPGVVGRAEWRLTH